MYRYSVHMDSLIMHVGRIPRLYTTRQLECARVLERCRGRSTPTACMRMYARRSPAAIGASTTTYSSGLRREVAAGPPSTVAAVTLGYSLEIYQ